MPFDAQHAYYQEHYAGAAFDVILVDGQPAGRLYVARESDEIRIIDIALLPEYLQPRHRDDAARRTAIRGGGRRQAPPSLFALPPSPRLRRTDGGQAAAHPRRTLQSRAPALRAPRVPSDRRSRRVSVHGMACRAVARSAKAGGRVQESAEVQHQAPRESGPRPNLASASNEERFPVALPGPHSRRQASHHPPTVAVRWR